MSVNERRGGGDFLDEVIAEAQAENPEFPAMVEAALERRALVRALAERREQLGLSQTAVAARMGTSQSAVARLEAAASDTRLTTLERYAAALGKRIRWGLSDPPASAEPAP